MKTTTLLKGFSTVIRTTFMNRAQALFTSMNDGTAHLVGSVHCPVRQGVADHRQLQFVQKRLESFRMTWSACN